MIEAKNTDSKKTKMLQLNLRENLYTGQTYQGKLKARGSQNIDIHLLGLFYLTKSLTLK